MKRFYLIALVLTFCFVGAQAQTPQRPTSEGPVWQLNYMKIKPGKGADFMKWSREYRVRMLEEWKRQGVILDYKFFTQPTRDNPGDWDVMEALLFKNYTELLEYDEAKSKKVEEIGQKIYGSAENRAKVGAELRDASREVVASQLVREMQFTPIN